ncbi:MAG: hypothetical protein N2578_05975, partial [Bdellovibrionaceae bacterium]|nr:hypothetical protein [Pseudobdellovibrionaceae bacterium]
MRRTLWILLTPTILLLLLLLAIEGWLLPKAAQWALQEIQYRQNTLPLQPQIGKIQFSLVRLKAEALDIQLMVPNFPDKDRSLAIKIEKTTARLGLFPLLTGRLRLSRLEIEKPQVKLELSDFPKQDRPLEELPLGDLFYWLGKIPLDEVRLYSPQLEFGINEFLFTLSSGQILARNGGDDLAVKINFEDLALRNRERTQQGPLAGVLEATLHLTLSRIDAEARIRAQGLELRLDGSFEQPKTLPTKPRGKVDLKLSSHLASLNEPLEIFLKRKLPALAGRLNLRSTLDFKSSLWPRGSFSLSSEKIFVGVYEVGNLRLAGGFDQATMSLSQASIEHSSGHARLNSAVLSLEPPWKFSAEVESHDFDLQKLFQSIDLKKVPVWLGVQTKIPCSGQVRDFAMSCRGDVTVSHLRVREEAREDSPEIVGFASGRAQGELHLNTERISWNAGLQIGKSTGRSDGFVDFAQGFNINYEGNFVRLEDIQKIAGLKLEGTGKIRGKTLGDSNTAIADMVIEGSNLGLDDYGLGNPSFRLLYERGVLHFSNLRGQFAGSEYSGELQINLRKSSLQGKILAPRLSLMDVRKA